MINNVVLVPHDVMPASPLRRTSGRQHLLSCRIATLKSKWRARKANFINVVIWQRVNAWNWAKKALIRLQAVFRALVTTRISKASVSMSQKLLRTISNSWKTRSNREGPVIWRIRWEQLRRQLCSSYGSAGSSGLWSTELSRDESPFGNSNPMDIRRRSLPF